MHILTYSTNLYRIPSVTECYGGEMKCIIYKYFLQYFEKSLKFGDELLLFIM